MTNVRLISSVLQYSSKMGYDAHKMADFFKVLEKMNMAQAEGGVPTWMSTHPDPGDRYVDSKQTGYAMAGQSQVTGMEGQH